MQILREYTTLHKVWREGGWVYKQQPKFLTQNEWWCLQTLYPSGYVPYAEHVSKDIVRMEDLGESEPITDTEQFMSHLPKMLDALLEAGIRHGDLTKYAIIVRENNPYLIDFAESRLWDDPRPDKRPERSDAEWLTETMKSLCP